MKISLNWYFFGSLIFPTVVFIIVKIAFIFISLTEVHINDFRESTVWEV